MALCSVRPADDRDSDHRPPKAHADAPDPRGGPPGGCAIDCVKGSMDELTLSNDERRLVDALDLIGETLGSDVEETLCDGLPGGAESVWDYDAQLVHDIANACRAWLERKGQSV